MRGTKIGLTRLFLLVWVAGFATTAAAALPPGEGLLLPLQDRVGNPKLTQLTESVLRRQLSVHAPLAEVDNVRATLRRLRIRDASTETPDRLAGLADSLEVQWFFLATLHEASEGRDSTRDPGISGAVNDTNLNDAGTTPQIVLSARVFRRDSEELWWAGFEAASGRDREKLLGLGKIESLEQLLQNAVLELVRKATAEKDPRTRVRFRRGKRGFLRAPIDVSSPGRVAVIPLDSVADQKPGASAELGTSALTAVLDELGFATLLPGLVREITQGAGRLQYGTVSRPEWEALARTADAQWVATGTVETYNRGQGVDPDPWVALSIRLIDAVDGRIHWIDGLEQQGKKTATAFDRGRIYSAGDLVQEMMRSLIGPAMAGSAGVKPGRRE